MRAVTFFLITCLAIAAIAYAAQPASAACSSCTVSISAASVPFGTYDPFASAPLSVTGTISILGSAAVAATIPVTVSLSKGAGTFAQRHFAASALQYGLFTSPGGSVFGDGTSGTSTVSVLALAALVPLTTNVPVYGTMAAHQTSSGPATYSDTITVTLTF